MIKWGDTTPARAMAHPVRALLVVASFVALVGARDWAPHVVLVDVDPPAPGKAMILPEDRQPDYRKIVVDPANRAIAFNAVSQLLADKDTSLVSRARIGVVNGNDLATKYPTRWIGIPAARRELRGCVAQPAEDLGAENEREYFLVRLNCSRIVADWDHVYLGVGVEGGSTKIIYLNEGAPMDAVPARNKNG